MAEVDPAQTLVHLADTRAVKLLMPKLGAASEPARIEKVDPWWREVRALEAGQRRVLTER